MKINIRDGFSHNSLNHKVHEMRGILRDWGKKQIAIGDASIWNRNAKSLTKVKDLEKVNLWMDSTDVPLTTPKGTSKKDRNWSYKCNKLGRRFQLIFDGKSICRRAFGGYSPRCMTQHGVRSIGRCWKRHIDMG